MAKAGRVLWLHTQPEHYHNCMLDDLARASDLEYIAAFSGRGTGAYTELPTPQVAQTVFLKTLPGLEAKLPTGRKAGHVDWRADLYPLKFDVAIVAGYAYRTHRELIHDCRRRGIPVAMWSDSNIRSQQGGVKGAIKLALKKIYLSSLIRDTDLELTANSQGVAYWKYFGAPAEKIMISPCYADYARVEQAKLSDRAAVLGKVGMSAEERLLFTAARLVPDKGLDLSIKAFRESGLPERGYRYLIAGRGPLEAELKQLAGDAEGKSIRFIGFQQPSGNLALIRHADVFVLPSVYEPHGIVVQEAMAAGTPVLASDAVGAAYDLVEAGVNGEIFRSGDGSDLRTKLVGMVSDTAKIEGMRRAAAEKFTRWFAEFSPIKIVDAAAHRMLAMKKNMP